MTQEDKQLLLKDICARLPYNCRVFYEYVDDLDGKTYGYSLTLNTWCINEFVANKAVIKPYLRPMSSMTEEESAELSNIISEWFDKELFYLTEEPFLEYALSRINYPINPLLFDWLNKNHFDYRGLIPKKLAIAVTKENNPYKNIEY